MAAHSKYRGIYSVHSNENEMKVVFWGDFETWTNAGNTNVQIYDQHSSKVRIIGFEFLGVLVFF